TKVVDGDTFQVKVGDEERRVRMLLVDAPEVTHDGGKTPSMPVGDEAFAYSTSVLLGKDVKLIFDGTTRVDKYGRTLAYVEVEGRDLGEDLISKGLGKMRYARDFETGELYDKMFDYREAEREASEQDLGIWQYDG